ncbi:hypothetical protein HYH03_012136 [Edaphochlamys debaryana]|uniref:Protein kinase domain-containing protein n=1 Tax=Edaphochlamys debaryana TaxID=47281 RepID=A0A835Y1B6_9CHLO|nr:hypothetical protein HYH03_012136 [Edaphochlamys debaryana]|eukprot:KAG2489304.1 hypothetical protein HYH03_012136 [Edaphochlamys debaryana]
MAAPGGEAAAPRRGRSKYLSFGSFQQFLSDYEPPRLELLPIASAQTTGVKDWPSAVVLWDTFYSECQAVLSGVPDGGPVTVKVPGGPATVGNEADFHRKFDHRVLTPLEEALDQALPLSDQVFEFGSATAATKGLGTNKSARPDFVLKFDAVNTEALLVAIELKTSAVLCVPHGSNLPDAYAAAAASGSGSNIVSCVGQLFSYLDGVPFGVLATDQQLFCMRREGTVLHCSPSIPLSGYVHCPAPRGPGRPSAAELRAAASASSAARVQFEAAGGRRADVLTAVAALYCMARMSQQWWASQQPTGGEGQGNSGGSDNRPRRDFLQMLAFFAMSIFKGAQHPAAAAAPTPVLRLPTDAESECTSRQLFPGRSFDPRAPGGTPPLVGTACLGIVAEGAVGGRSAAVKLVDLWQGPEGKEAILREVRIYQLLKPLQGVYVPHLLGYGFCDGWQYFLATSLEGPNLDSEEGWTVDEEATCAAAFTALDAVHRCGVLHGDVALRNFVLVVQPAGVGGSVAGGGRDGGGGSQASTSGQQPQLQPRVMLLDFGHSQLLAEAAKARGVEPAALIQQERRALQNLLDWEPPSPLPVPLDMALPGSSAAASGPGPPAAPRSAGPLSAFPPSPALPRPPIGPSGWRQQLRFSGLPMPHMSRRTGLNGGRSASSLSFRRP